MARQLFPGAWLRKPHYAQVGRQRTSPRGGRAGRPVPASFPPRSAPLRSYLRRGRPPRDSPLSPARRGCGRRSFPPAPGGGRGWAAPLCAAARAAGGCGAGAEALAAASRPLSGWSRGPGAGGGRPLGPRCLLPPLSPSDRASLAGPAVPPASRSALPSGPRCPPAGPVTRQPARGSRRLAGGFQLGSYTRGMAGAGEVLTLSPTCPSLAPVAGALRIPPVRGRTSACLSSLPFSGVLREFVLGTFAVR